MLTNLYNRKAFEEALKRHLFKSKLKENTLAILVIDLDNFKMVNDTFGHHIGDCLLQIVAKQLQHIVGKNFVARLGGNEQKPLL